MGQKERNWRSVGVLLGAPLPSPWGITGVMYVFKKIWCVVIITGMLGLLFSVLLETNASRIQIVNYKQTNSFVYECNLTLAKLK